MRIDFQPEIIAPFGMPSRYEPRIERDPVSGLIQQTFRSTRIELAEEENTSFIQLAEDFEESTIHSLLFAITSEGEDVEDSELYVEFNDQGNGLFNSEVGQIELLPDRLILTPASTRKLQAGRVSYQADPFEGDVFGSEIDRVIVLLECDRGSLLELSNALLAVTMFGVEYQVQVIR